MHEGDGGNFEVRGAEANPLLSQNVKLVNGSLIQRHERPSIEESHKLCQVLIIGDLLTNVASSADFRQPSAHLLFERNDANGDFEFSCRLQTSAQGNAAWMFLIPEDGHVVGV